MVIFVVRAWRNNSVFINECYEEIVGAYSSLSKAINKADEYVYDEALQLHFSGERIEIIRMEVDRKDFFFGAGYCSLDVAKNLLKRTDDDAKFFRGEKEENAE